MKLGKLDTNYQHLGICILEVEMNPTSLVANIEIEFLMFLCSFSTVNNNPETMNSLFFSSLAW